MFLSLSLSSETVFLVSYFLATTFRFFIVKQDVERNLDFFLLVIIVVGLLFSCLSVLRGKSAPLLILCPGVIVLIKHYSGLLVENVWCFCLTSNVPWLHLVSISFSLFFRPLSHPLWVVSS